MMKSILSKNLLIALLMTTSFLLFNNVVSIFDIGRLLITSSLFIVPGYLILRMFGQLHKYGLVESIPTAFCLSWAFLSMVGTGAYFFRAKLVSVILIVLAVIAILAIINLCKRNAKWYCKIEDHQDYIILLVVFFIGLVALNLGARAGNGLHYSFDSFHRLSFMQKIRAQDFADPSMPFVSGNYFDPNYSFNLNYLIFALWSKIANVELLHVYIFSIVIILPMIYLAMYVLAKEIFQDKNMALTSSLLLLFYDLFFFLFQWSFSLNFHYWQSANSDRRMVVTIFNIVCLSFIIRYFRKNRLSTLIMIGAVAFASITCNKPSSLIIPFSMVCMFFYYVIRKIDIKKTIASIAKVALIIGIFALPYVMSIFPHLSFPDYYRLEDTIQKGYDMKNADSWLQHLYSDRMKRQIMTIINDGFFIVKPHLAFRGNVLMFFAFLMAFFYWKRARDVGHHYLVSTTIFAPLIIGLPPIAYYLNKVISLHVLTSYLTLSIPFILVIAWFLSEYNNGNILNKFQSVQWGKKATVWIGILLLLVLIKSEILSLGNGVFYRKDVDAYLKKLPKGANLMTNPEIGYTLPALTYVNVGVNINASSIFNESQRERYNTLYRMLHGSDNLEKTIRFIRDNNYEYIFLNTKDYPYFLNIRLVEKVVSMLKKHHIDINFTHRTQSEKIFLNNPEYFQKVYHDGYFSVYKVLF